MAKITLSNITTPYTTSLNANFTTLITELQDKVLYRNNPAGEPNSMQNDLDMNSNDILNAGNIDTSTLTVGGSVLISNDQVTTTQAEVQALSSAQTSVTFTNPTANGTFYLNGVGADRGRLIQGTDYTMNNSTRTVTLTESYPAGTQLIMVYFEGDGALVTSSALAYSTVADMKASNAAPGQTILTDGYYTAGDGGGAKYLIKSAADFGGTPDGYGDHALANGNVAVLQVSGLLNFLQLGGGAVDNGPILDAITRSCHIPEGTYNTSTLVTWGLSNAVISGDGIDKTTITSSTIRNLIILGSVANLTFKDITFETTTATAGDDVFGLIYGDNSLLSNINFIRCKFTAPNTATNAIKLIQEDADVADGIHFTDCVFDDIGRMGVEVQNHNDASPLVRYRNITTTRCVFKDTGQHSIYGMGVSLSGIGAGCSVDSCTFDNNLDSCIEGVGVRASTFVNNKFTNQTRSVALLSFTGTRGMSNNIFKGNVSDSIANGVVRIRDQVDPIFSDNSLGCSYLEIKETSGLRGSNNVIRADGVYALLFDTNCSDNEFNNSVFDNSASASNFSTVRFNAATVTDNRLIRCTVNKGTGGAPADQTGSAVNNWLFATINGATGQPYSAFVIVTMSDANYDATGDLLAVMLPRLIRINGTLTATRQFIIPDKIYEPIAIWNNTNQTLDIKPPAASGDLLPTLERATVYFDDTRYRLV